ncbi:conserved hypothetical protein [Burkholderiales bacterium 8X]|nr:conserved hypothetical protein [Burkholderiales bacterium 8X]
MKEHPVGTNDANMAVTPKLAFDLNLALYLDLISVLERSGVVTYRQMAARILNISMDARDDGDAPLAQALEGIAQGFAGQGGGFSMDLMKAARGLRNDEALGDVPHLPDPA